MIFVAFLGNIIFSEGIEVNPSRTKAVKNCPRHLIPTNIKFFLGLSVYYRRFVDGFASITSSLTTLTQKSVKFKRSEASERRFELLKDRLTFAPVLSLLEVTKGFVVYYNAS